VKLFETIYNNPWNVATLPHYIVLNGKIHPKMKIVIPNFHDFLFWWHWPLLYLGGKKQHTLVVCPAEESHTYFELVW